MATNPRKPRILKLVGLGAALALATIAMPAHGAPDDGLIPPLKDVYSDYFKVGNIYSGPQTYEEVSPNWAQVERHYNVMTAENIMKPDQLLPNQNINPDTGEWTFNFAPADYFVDESLERGIDVHGHVLVWHSQSPARIFQGGRDAAKANMERYIKEVLTHFKGRVVSWDVVNEAFVDGIGSFDPETQNWEDFLRGNPTDYSYSGWYNAYTTDMDVEAGERPGDFIYDAFVFARQYGPETKLEYNDFNVFQSEGKAKAILAMATELNERYAAQYPDDPRQLIETIGLQSHNYINQTPAFACSDLTLLPELVDDNAEEWKPGACSNDASVERSLQLIIDAGFTANVSELDLQVWEAWNAEPEGTDKANYAVLNDESVAARFYKDGFTYWVGKIESRTELEAIQAQRFAEYFAVYKKYSQDMDRVTFWGLNDYLNWRATHNPQLFNRDWSEKLSAPAVADPEAWLGLKKPVVDTSALAATVAEAKALDLRGNVYTGKSLGAVKSALGKANAVIKSSKGQAEVNAAQAALADAIASLKLK
ncbi:MAG TPA: endo-1,4-beta-xylanase [Tessaracoccus flavescens]|uniref:Endo-1,4-beta-xylanase n=1 Tax=Tessaracoccus flavescens TaxID=399497 RepID=A0A921JRD6_9ACTN|nr:endo-1,4-beta-xylanase [Tessaracoccus flavescens]